MSPVLESRNSSKHQRRHGGDRERVFVGNVGERTWCSDCASVKGIGTSRFDLCLVEYTTILKSEMPERLCV